ncbi:hypothetical protein NC653_040034 [Populus alba x Populus x berolinensis]|uniref:Uncharacterized protein n=1 Tax=Populus alba x Populus x berolinensis TaxID=444605 RepID=A0AAD6LCU5_9ROSI|nr:hypothetical protein NC653_040034 [Populus alba x Populus x berolinensis]
MPRGGDDIFAVQKSGRKRNTLPSFIVAAKKGFSFLVWLRNTSDLSLVAYLPDSFLFSFPDLNLSSELAPALLFDKYEEEVWGKTPDHSTDNGSCLNLHLKTCKDRFIY